VIVLHTLRAVESPLTIPEVTSSETRGRRGGRGRRRRRGRQRKNEIAGSETAADSDADGKTTSLRQAIEQRQQQQWRHQAAELETTTTARGGGGGAGGGEERRPPWRLPAPTGNEPTTPAPPGDDDENDSDVHDDWEASGNEASDDETN